jgi:hypothetical protein
MALKRVKDLKLLDTIGPICGSTAKIFSISVEDGLHRLGLRFLEASMFGNGEEQFLTLNPNILIEASEYCRTSEETERPPPDQ